MSSKSPVPRTVLRGLFTALLAVSLGFPSAHAQQGDAASDPSSTAEAAPDQRGAEPPSSRAADLQESEARRAFEEGERAYAQGNFEQALEAFRRAFDLAHPSRRIYILYNIGVCHDQLGHAAEAVRFYEQYLTLVPEGPRHQWVRGRIRVLRARAEAEAEASPRDEAARAEPLREAPAKPDEEQGSGGSGLLTAALVGGGVLLVGGIVAAVLLAGGEEAPATTLGTFEALR